MSLFHLSDPHLSFVPASPIDVARGEITYSCNGTLYKVAKRMDQRTWSKGLDNYQGYIDRILEHRGIAASDILVITGDLGHDMSPKNVPYTLEFIDRELPGIKVVCRGNHDWGWDFGKLRAMGIARRTFMVEEGTMQSVGDYMFGCWSDHRGKTGDTSEQNTFSANEDEVVEFAFKLAAAAREAKKLPIFISHYPVRREVAERIGLAGIAAYLSGHIHCTNNKVPGGVDWSWYSKTAAQTDDQEVCGCFFSTGTTDVLFKKHGVAAKEIKVPVLPVGPRPRKVVVPEKPSPQVVLLIGPPGAGKTTACSRYKDHVRISQDDLGSKSACFDAMVSALEKGLSVVVDRTNIDRSQRAPFVQLAKRYRAREVVAVWFATSRDECVKRVQERKGHPTINDQVPLDKRQAIVDKFVERFQQPIHSEGFNRIYLSDNSGRWARVWPDPEDSLTDDEPRGKIGGNEGEQHG